MISVWVFASRDFNLGALLPAPTGSKPDSLRQTPFICFSVTEGEYDEGGIKTPTTTRTTVLGLSWWRRVVYEFSNSDILGRGKYRDVSPLPRLQY